MILTINGKQAALKKGSSIEYVSENRIFTDADDYSMEIELPLADCPQNLDIYAIARKVDQGTQGIGNPLKSQRTSIEVVRFGGSMRGHYLPHSFRTAKVIQFDETHRRHIGFFAAVER